MNQPFHPRQRGFTLVEILIALFFLGVGFVGVLGLLTTSVKETGNIIERSLASNLARSVQEATRVGAREFPFVVEEGVDGQAVPRLVRGFLLLHPGVSDGDSVPVPQLPAHRGELEALEPLRASDRALFLPNEDQFFVFPRPNGASADNEDDGTDNVLEEPVESSWGHALLDVKRVYQLENQDPAVRDAVSQYGFALAIRRSFVPPVGGEGSAEVTSGLYEVRIMIFRNFTEDPELRGHYPVSQFTTLIAIGAP